jgi:Tol biopolymer transport system component
MEPEKRLESWKEIEAYLKRDVRTLRRWEKEEGLPVHRHPHKIRSSVYAYPSEIDAWRASRKVAAEPPPPPPALWRRFLRPAAALTLLLCLVMGGSGIRPVEARQSDGKISVQQVWVTRNSDDPHDLSPDGRYFVFTDWKTGDLAVHDLKTGANRHLTSNTGKAEAEDAVFSRDGRQIAYDWFRFDGPHSSEGILIVPSAGGAPREIWNSKDTDDWLVPLGWTPDAKQLLVRAVISNKRVELALLSLADGSLHPVKTMATGLFGASLSPDGRWIVYSVPNPAGGNSVFVLSTDGSRESKVDHGGGAKAIWSPDGSRIFFISGRTGPGRRTLWSAPFVDGKPGKEELIRDDIGTDLWMTRTGTLYFQTPGVGGPNIYSAELSDGIKVSQTAELAVPSSLYSNGSPLLSPDGAYLFYWSTVRGAMMRTLATGEEHPVPLTARCGVASWWHPDQRSLLVSCRDPQVSSMNFYLTDWSTGNRQLLFTLPEAFNSLSLSRDGKTVFYSQPYCLVRYDLDTKKETELKKVDSALGIDSFYSTSLSPDGTQLAYVFWTGDAGSKIEVVPTTGGPSREVVQASPWNDGSRYNALAWTPDQRYILFTPSPSNDGQVSLWRVPASGGAAEQVGLTMRGLTSVQVQPDAHRLFFGANDAGPREIWALENFLPGSK